MTAAGPGRLLLVPNTLDLGDTPVDIRDVLPDGVLRRAAGLRQWIVEDARSARAFLKRVDAVHRLCLPLQRLRIDEIVRAPKGRAPADGRHSGQASIAAWLQAAIDEAGHDIGLLSEAGLPGVADPGAPVVAQAHRMGIEVVALPGASSLLLALAASGMNGQQFAFVGYVPQDADDRRRELQSIEARSAALEQTQVLIETPYRNDALLQALLLTLRPDTRLAVSRGLTQAGARQRSAAVAEWQALGAGPSWNGAPAVFVLQARPQRTGAGATDGRPRRTADRESARAPAAAPRPSAAAPAAGPRAAARDRHR